MRQEDTYAMADQSVLGFFRREAIFINYFDDLLVEVTIFAFLSIESERVSSRIELLVVL
jgi:hypothetical protein